MPFLFYFEGKFMAYNMAFLPSKQHLPFVILNYVLHCLIVIIDVIWVLRYYGLGPWKTPSVIYGFELLSLNLCHLIRLLIIAIKYGFVLSDPWWKQRLQCTYLGGTETLSLLLAVWLRPTTDMVERELAIAQERTGEVIHGRKFLSTEDSGHILRVFRDPMAKESVGFSKMDAWEFAVKTLHKAANLDNPLKLMTFLGLTFGFLPK